MDNSNNLSATSEKKKIPKRTFVIEDVIVKDYDKMEPCLVQFSNGVVKDDSKLEGKLLTNMSEKNIRRRSERILTVSSDKMTYTGKNFGDNVDPNVTNRNFLGVLDKKTNKMKLIEISTFTMHPQFNAKPQTSTDSFLSNLTQTQNEKRKQLNETFGGRRERATIKKIVARQFDVHDMAGALHDMTQKIDTEGLEEGFEEVFSYDDILPPCDRDANVVENVYKLGDIIPDTELVLYNDEALEYMDNKRDLDCLSPLVRQTIANAKISVDEEETAKLICIALYIQNLIDLLLTRFKENPVFKACPKLMEKKILSKFTEGKRKRKSKALEDKLIAYIIVLSFIANQFGLQWTTLCQSLSIKKDRLTTIINIIGAKVVKSKGCVSLEVPLAKNVHQTPLRVRQKKRRKL